MKSSNVYPACFITLVALASLCVSCAKNDTVEPPTPGFTFDVFPLAVGSHFTYSYHYDYSSSSLGIFRDSGTVAYRIADSTPVHSGTKQWTVEETRHILHTSFYPVQAPYWIDTTVLLSLTESLDGKHELRCDGLVWFCPLFSGNPDFAPVYRYAGNPTEVVQLSLGADAYWAKDSIALEAHVGLTRRSYASGGWANSAVRSTRSAQLIGNTDGSSGRMTGPSYGGRRLILRGSQ